MNQRLTIAVVLSGSPMIAICFTAISPVIPQIAGAFADRVDAPTLFAQLVIAYAATGMMFGGMAGGWLAGRYGASRVLVLMLAVFLVCGTGGYFISDPTLLLASRVLLGACACAAQTCCIELTGALFGPQMRVRILSLQPAAGAVFALFTLLLAGEIASYWGWSSVYFLYLLSAPVLIAALMLPRVDKQTTQNAAAPAGWKPYLKLWWIFAAMASVSILLNMPSIQLPLKLAAEGVMDPATNARVVAAFSMTLSVSAVFYGFVRGHVGTHGVLLLGLAILGVGYVLIGKCSTPWSIAAAAALGGIGAGLINPHFAILVVDRASAAIRARALGLLMSCFFFGEFLVPYTANPLRVAFGIDAMLIIFGGLALIASVIGAAALARGQPG